MLPCHIVEYREPPIDVSAPSAIIQEQTLGSLPTSISCAAATYDSDTSEMLDIYPKFIRSAVFHLARPGTRGYQITNQYSIPAHDLNNEDK